MKTSCAIVLLLSAVAVPELGRAQDPNSDISAAKGTKECRKFPTELCEATILEVNAENAEIWGDIPGLADEDGSYLGLEPHDQAAPFALYITFQLSSCAVPSKPFFLRIVTRADSSVETKIALRNLDSKEYDGILETRTFFDKNDYAARVDAPSMYVSGDGKIELSLFYQLLPAEPESLELRGANKIGIDLDKVEIFE